MLEKHTNFDQHLDYLLEKQGHAFKLDLTDVTKVQLPIFCKHLYETIKNSIYAHTLILLPKMSGNRQRMAMKAFKTVANKIDKDTNALSRKHQIHVFFLPRDIYQVTIEEMPENTWS